MINPGARIHRVSLANPGAVVPDGDGGFSQAWTPLTPPTLRVSLKNASARDLERLAAGTVLASATHIVEAPYHAEVTTQTRLTFESGRLLSVTSIDDVEQRHLELVLLCEEVVT